MNSPPPSWTPGVCWWLPRQERLLGWTEGLEQNPFKDGLSAQGLGWWAWCQGSWGEMRDPRELGFYITLDGHVLEAVLEIRDGTDSWRLVLWHQLYRPCVPAGPRGPRGLGSWAVYSTCTVWSPLSLDSPFFWGTRVPDEQGCGGVQGLPGLRRGQETWQSLLDTDILFFVLLQPECQALGVFPVRSGFQVRDREKNKLFPRKNILDHDLTFYDFKWSTFQTYSSRLQWWVSLRRNKYIWNV